MNRQSLVILMEAIWWAATALIVFAVLWPIHKAMRTWPFEISNIVFIVTLITLTRYMFLTEYTFLAKRQILKIVLLVLAFPATFLLVSHVFNFANFIEENTWEPLTGHLPEAEKQWMEKYIWAEMLFFGVGSVICTPIFAVQMMVSIWKTRNREN